MTAAANAGARRLIAGKRVVICGGSGGVGKTTTSAALATGMAARGHRVVVVTIDPARRLADALGLDALGNEPVRVDPSAFADAGLPFAPGGELWATMLDAKRTFDDLIERLAPDTGTRDEIFANRIYRELSGAVAGSQEFTAIAKLHELAQRTDFDLLVLDTPPSRNALDFLDAPDRLTQFFEGRALQALLSGGRGPMRLLGRGTGLALSALRKVTGVDLLSDLSSFFRLLGGLLEGFRERAAQVDALLHDPATTFLLVTSPEREPIDEAIYFHRKLRAARMPFGGAIVNRVHDDHLGDADAGDLPRLLAGEAGLSAALAARVAAAFQDEHALALRDRANIARLAQRLGAGVPLVRVPHLDADVHDAEGLVRLHRHLFAERAAPRVLPTAPG
jgi:anion-transporting  ArsA/GET3 family ATPase